MSEQNKKTLEVYDRLAQKYIDNTAVHDRMNPERAKERKAKIESFLLESFTKMPKGGKILEVGSGDGANATFLRDAGFNVVASDVAEPFLNSCHQKGLETLKLDIINNDLPNELSGILAWRVFVHFTKEDLEKTFSKIHSALASGGIFVFNVFNRDDSGIDEQWKDFPNEYMMGEERYFAYYAEPYIEALIKKTGFKLVTFFREGGKTGNKWLCYVVAK